jgi:hypothetical protein
MLFIIFAINTVIIIVTTGGGIDKSYRTYISKAVTAPRVFHLVSSLSIGSGCEEKETNK